MFKIGLRVFVRYRGAKIKSFQKLGGAMLGGPNPANYGPGLFCLRPFLVLALFLKVNRFVAV